jgi:quercetin dioxygenase-like cupin family protein
VVIKERVHIWVEDEEYVLEEGDAITLESSRPHRIANLDDETAIVISSITPPSF